MLDDLGLVPALEWQGAKFRAAATWKSTFIPSMFPNGLSDEVKVCIYRLVQEALNNAARHSAARHAKVSVRRWPAKYTWKSSDDGKGFLPERIRGMGILGMEERVKRLGGTLDDSIDARHRHNRSGGAAFASTGVCLTDEKNPYRTGR